VAAAAARMNAGVVIVNWRGSSDTIECLESVFRSDYPPGFQVVICDNGSGDGSLRRIREWAEGAPGGGADSRESLRHLVEPPVRKPIEWAQLTRAEAEAGGSPESGSVPLVLVDVGENIGFAGGCNVGLRYLLSRGCIDYCWLLNNDCVVDPEALRELVREVESRQGSGICGSTLLRYGAPDRVQAFGGASYNRWLALSRHLGEDEPYRPSAIDREEVLARTEYVVGASMLIRSEVLRRVGLLDERYFLYFEEIDLALRARAFYSLAYSPGSLVYHKEGATIGSGSQSSRKSWISDFYWIRSRIIFTRKHMPFALPTVYLAIVISALKRLARGEFRKAALILRIMARPQAVPARSELHERHHA